MNFYLWLCWASGRCLTSSSGREGVIPEQENQTAAGPDRGERNPRWRNQGHEGHAGGQGKED